MVLAELGHVFSAAPRCGRHFARRELTRLPSATTGLYLIEVRNGAVPRSQFVGSQACADCHAEAYQAWRGSHHDLAMAEPTETTVLGDFGDAELTAHGVTSRFFRRDGGWFVNTDGPDGELHDYPVAYTFGWYPLQQHLIRFPGGRLQALGLAWDSRPSDEGGQRWFHLYPDEP